MFCQGKDESRFFSQDRRKSDILSQREMEGISHSQKIKNKRKMSRKWEIGIHYKEATSLNPWSREIILQYIVQARKNIGRIQCRF